MRNRGASDIFGNSRCEIRTPKFYGACIRVLLRLIGGRLNY